MNRVIAAALLLVSWGSGEALAQVPPGGTMILGEKNHLGYLDKGNANLLLAQGPSRQLGDCCSGSMVRVPTGNTQRVLVKATVPICWYCLAYLPSDNKLSFRKGYGDVPEVNYPLDFNVGLPATFAANPCCGDGGHWMFYASLIAGSTPQIVISFDPPNPTIASGASNGDPVATVTASWSDGSPFAGSLAFGSPYADDNGTFALTGNQIAVANAAALVAEGGTTQQVTVVATQ